MKQRQFEAQQAASWQRFAHMLGDAPRTAALPAAPPEALHTNVQFSPAPAKGEAFVRHYRLVCRDLALAEARGYSPGLVDYLNDLAMRGHHRVYTRRSGWRVALRTFVLRDFARLVRQEWRLVAMATAIFLLPTLLISLAVLIEPSAVYFVLGPAETRSFEEMYAPGQAILGPARESGDDFAMFGYYIRNNIGVGFQCFATGVLFGLGPVFYLTVNGLLFGAVAAHLGSNGYASTFFPFVIGHGAFELTAIVLSGAAGLKLGSALLSPGRHLRRDALVQHGRIAIRIMFGVFLMLLIAAFVEAFWSARALVPAWTRVSVGVLLWLLVLAYFAVAGRGRRA